jgi:hypothetical protein
VVVGEEVDAFSRRHRQALTGQGQGIRRHPPCRGLGAAAAGHGDRPEPAAALSIDSGSGPRGAGVGVREVRA